MLQRLDIPALSLSKTEVNTTNIYAISRFSYCEANNDLKSYHQEDNRIQRDRNIIDASIILNDDSWSDSTYPSSISSGSIYSLSTSTSTLIDEIVEKPSIITNDMENNQRRPFSVAFQHCYADRQNENDARNAMDNVTQDQDGLTDDEMTLYGDEEDTDIIIDDTNNNNNNNFTPLKFTKKKQIHFVKHKSFLSSMLLLHSPPAFASSSTLSLANASSSFISSCSSNVTKNMGDNYDDDLLSSSMKEHVRWENLQNCSPAGRLVGSQNTNNISFSSTLPIKNSFDTSTSCW